MMILFILTIILLIGLIVFGTIMYDIDVPNEPTTEMEQRCIDIKEKIRWLNWKLLEQKSKGENSF